MVDDYWEHLKRTIQLAKIQMEVGGVSQIFTDLDDEDVEAIVPLLSKELRTPGEHVREEVAARAGYKVRWVPGKDAKIGYRGTSFGIYEFYREDDV